ncbi:unnamed protein product [Parascedosporium putredinis]|uniref:NADH dehydrogenase [ubiquinone] 1 alpha subcomplex subunit n=1 Tax=Parascedosporium putredinis TaxID=1442378 RepID=A0A9P1H1B0_9PEZI|nr:unnamed protein product [Parascedosporium putredinis]CAI7994987.1 unnamed protein product [Parascedosporium putredinis]
MSTLPRTLSNLRKVGIKDYFKQMLYIVRTRWVEYAKHDYDAAQVDPGWHAWLAYMVDKPPTQDGLLQTKARSAIPNYTGTRSAFKTYNTLYLVYDS